MLWWVIFITTVAGIGGTGLGGALGACFERDSKKVVSLLLSFAGGVMLSVVCFDLLLDALSIDDSGRARYLWQSMGGLSFGFGLIALLNYVIDRSTKGEVGHTRADDHPKTADDLDELIHSNHFNEHKKERAGKKNNGELFVAGVIMAAAIALHNLPEGMVIGATYAGQRAASIWSGSGLVIAIVIGLHNVPEGMAVSVPLIAGGMRKSRAIWVTALTGAPTVLGAILGYLLGSMGAIWHVLALSFASGAMLYVVFGELLPEAILMWRSKLPALGLLIGMMTGILIIFA